MNLLDVFGINKTEKYNNNEFIKGNIIIFIFYLKYLKLKFKRKLMDMRNHFVYSLIQILDLC